MTSVNKNSSVFCNNVDNNSEICNSLTIDQKKEILKKQGRCYSCLQSKHRNKDLGNTKMCDFCSKKHNRAIYFRHAKMISR